MTPKEERIAYYKSLGYSVSFDSRMEPIFYLDKDTLLFSDYLDTSWSDFIGRGGVEDPPEALRTWEAVKEFLSRMEKEYGTDFSLEIET